VYIKTLRKKLDEILPSERGQPRQKLIHTVVGVGYALKME